MKTTIEFWYDDDLFICADIDKDLDGTPFVCKLRVYFRGTIDVTRKMTALEDLRFVERALDEYQAEQDAGTEDRLESLDDVFERVGRAE